MKSIKRKDFIEVGSVIKTHGTQGELKVRLSQEVKFKEWAFLEIQGKPVPFKIVSVFGTDDEPFLQFEGVCGPIEAEKLCGKMVLMPKRNMKRRNSHEDIEVEGFALIDKKLGKIGVVVSLEEYPHQLLLRTTFKGEEVLIPAVDEFILEIDEQKQVIYLNLPEGLL